jgi:magnesium-protoporphyrin IX monomethyl ester (oxidative) cyclase
MLWKFQRVYNPRRQLEDHFAAVHYELPEPPPETTAQREKLYVHLPARIARRTAQEAAQSTGS